MKKMVLTDILLLSSCRMKYKGEKAYQIRVGSQYSCCLSACIDRVVGACI